MASEGLIRGVFEGSIVGPDMEIERRPYHKNCSCALHNKTRSCTRGSPCNAKISYPARRSWSESCLVMQASSHASPSPTSSPTAAAATSSIGMEKAHHLYSQGPLHKRAECGVSWEI